MTLDPEPQELEREYRRHNEAAEHYRQQAMEAKERYELEATIARNLLRLHPELREASKHSSQPEEPERDASGGDAPRGALALEMLLSDRPSEFFTSTQLHGMLLSKGWADPGSNGQAAVRSNVTRAVAAGLMVKRPLDKRSFEYAWRPRGGVRAADSELAAPSGRPPVNVETHADEEVVNSFDASP